MSKRPLSRQKSKNQPKCNNEVTIDRDTEKQQNESKKLKFVNRIYFLKSFIMLNIIKYLNHQQQQNFFLCYCKLSYLIIDFQSIIQFFVFCFEYLNFSQMSL